MDFYEIQKKLVSSAVKKNIPIAGEFELTSHCNLDCKMCYVRDNLENNLSKEEWIRIIKEAHACGLLFATITGGDPFTRPDFFDIYNTIFDLGILPTIYTNGLLIDDKIIQKLKERKPSVIAITLYGGSDEVYYKVTGQKDGFTRVKEIIKKLKLNSFNLVIRTIAIKEILDSISEVVHFVKSMNIPIMQSLYVTKSKEGKEERLSPSDLIKYQDIFQEEFGINYLSEYRYSDNGFQCVSGKAAFFVNCKGFMSPCPILPYPKVKVNGFSDAWNIFHTEIEKISSCKECINCKYNNACIQCPAKRYNEEGFNRCSVYLKEIAKLRYNKEINNEKRI